jgi:hypothetical protein
MPEQNIDVRYEAGKVLTGTGNQEQFLATFNEKTGALEFQTEQAAYSFRQKVLVAVGTTGDNKNPKDSGRRVTSMGLKGWPIDAPTPGEPARPVPGDKMGDNRPSLVRWLFEYRPHEAYLTYRVHLGKDGKPIRADVQRKSRVQGAPPEVGAGYKRGQSGSWISPGSGAMEGGALDAEGNPLFKLETFRNQIIADRGTCMTFLPNEMVGGSKLLHPEADDSAELFDTPPPQKVYRREGES